MNMRRGLFKISTDLIESEPDVVRKIMGKCIIIRAEHLYGERVVTYAAISPEFDEVPRGEIAPEYLIEIRNRPVGYEIVFVKQE